MPEVFANEHAKAPEARIESAHRFSRGEEPSLIEQAVGRQVDLVVNVNEFAL